MEVDRLRGRETYGDNPHGRDADGPFHFNLLNTDDVAESLSRATAFSMVRNPYTRILASYLDKVGRDRFVWPSFARRFSIPESCTQDDFSFGDFLRAIDREPDELLDPRFRPQYLNLLMPLVQLHLIGFIEAPESVSEFLQETRGIKLGRHPKAETHSAQLLQKYYSDELAGLVRERFSTDFETFGYSADIAHADDPGVLPTLPEPTLDALIGRCRTGSFDRADLDPPQNAYNDFSAAAGLKGLFRVPVGVSGSPLAV